MSNSFYTASNQNMKDYNLGSDMFPGYGLFDETKTYVAGEIVLWKGFLYIVKSGHTSTPNNKGVFTNNPETDSAWEPYETTFKSAYCYIKATQTTLGSSDVSIIFDTIGYNDNIIDNLDTNSGNINISTDKLCLIIVTPLYDCTSGTSRSGARTFVQYYNGQDWNNVPGSLIYTYHRQYNVGETGGACSFIIDCKNIESFRVRARRYVGNSTIKTMSDNSTGTFSFTIVELVGGPGAQGPPGPPGADGDITWEGTWNSTRNYLTNQAVEYQGSSYVCIQNTTAYQPPTDTNYWDLMSQKGTDGSGSSIQVRDDNSLISNTPHTSLDFIYPIEASDSGGGIATVSFTERPRIMYGASGDQTITSNSTWQVLNLNKNILVASQITRSGNRLYANSNLQCLVCYNIFYYLDSGDNTRNTMQAALRLNGSAILNYTMSGAYTRGYIYSKHANSCIPYTYIQLAQNDYIELVFRGSDDYQSPHVGVEQSWILFEILR